MFHTEKKMIQYHTPSPRTPSRRVAASHAGEYAMFTTREGAYVNGPFGYLRTFASVKEAVAHMATLRG